MSQARTVAFNQAFAPPVLIVQQPVMINMQAQNMMI